MLPEISESELPTQEPEDETPSIFEPGSSEEQRIDTPVPTRKRKDWTSIVGTRTQPARESKSRVKAVRSDPDHLMDEQAWNYPQAAEWAKAREKERD